MGDTESQHTWGGGRREALCCAVGLAHKDSCMECGGEGVVGDQSSAPKLPQCFTTPRSGQMLPTCRTPRAI